MPRTTSMTDPERAHQDGYAEGHAGVRLKDNPFVHDASPECWLAWRDGWWRAMQERIDAESSSDKKPRCETCHQTVESVNEVDQCEDCHAAWVEREMTRLYPLYEAEKAAGLLKSREEYEAEMVDAGRGHLLRR